MVPARNRQGSSYEDRMWPIWVYFTPLWPPTAVEKRDIRKDSETNFVSHYVLRDSDTAVFLCSGGPRWVFPNQDLSLLKRSQQ